MNSNPSKPIGIFDSGVGGLTVAHAIKQVMPEERLIYFGDTFHLPYGDKSPESVKFYSTRIAEYLLEQDCKMVLIACNTASALAWEEVCKLTEGKALAINVIDPVIDEVAHNPTASKIGIIGTKGTVNSGTYKVKLIQKNSRLEVKSLATPMFVPMIEEGFIYDDISNAIIRTYLSREELQGIDTMILGCTHYPIIKNQIAKYYNFRVNVVDSAMIVANYVKQSLRSADLLYTGERTGENSFLVSDYTDFFSVVSRMFFGESIRLKKVDLWQ